MRTEVLSIRTGDRPAVRDITASCTAFVAREGDGLLNVVVPVFGGALSLGMWQSVCLVDTNVDNPVREVRLSFLPG